MESTQLSDVSKNLSNQAKTKHMAKGGESLLKAIIRYKLLYLIALPGILYFILFCYAPMFGVIIAFKDYNPVIGFVDSPWVGFKFFNQFFHSFNFVRLMRNTLLINGMKLIIGIPIPIIFALLMNEVGNRYFKKIVQSFSYFPHFISWIVAVGLIQNLFSPSMGLIPKLISGYSGDFPNIFMEQKYFYPLIIISFIWKEFGWGSIIYFAAISGLDVELYEAARLDGCGRWRQTWHITLPGIKSLIVLLTLLNLGNILSSDFGQLVAIIDQNAALYEVGDVIDTFVYRFGLLTGNFSYGTAVGLFKGIISLVLVWTANFTARKLGEDGIW